MLLSGDDAPGQVKLKGIDICVLFTLRWLETAGQTRTNGLTFCQTTHKDILQSADSMRVQTCTYLELLRLKVSS